MTLTDTLGRGRDNVTSSYTIATRLGVPQQTIGFMVNDLRKQGHLIESVYGEGYYLIETAEELADTIRHIEQRKAGIDRTIRALEGAWLAESA